MSPPNRGEESGQHARSNSFNPCVRQGTPLSTVLAAVLIANNSVSAYTGETVIAEVSRPAVERPQPQGPRDPTLVNEPGDCWVEPKVVIKPGDLSCCKSTPLGRLRIVRMDDGTIDAVVMFEMGREDHEAEVATELVPTSSAAGPIKYADGTSSTISLEMSEGSVVTHLGFSLWAIGQVRRLPAAHQRGGMAPGQLLRLEYGAQRLGRPPVHARASMGDPSWVHAGHGRPVTRGTQVAESCGIYAGHGVHKSGRTPLYAYIYAIYGDEWHGTWARWTAHQSKWR